MNNSVCRAYNKKPYELVFGRTPHGYSTMLNQLFQNNIFSEDEIPNEFEGNDLIDNTTYEINSTNLNQELNLDEDAHSLQPLQDLTNQLTRGHQVLQDFACQNLETYTTKMTSAMIAKSKHKLEYEIREYVKILICKVIEKLNYNDTFKYRLGCISGILNNLYCADNISVREAARNQSSSTGMLTGSMCKCKSNCKSAIQLNAAVKNLVLDVEVNVIVENHAITKLKINNMYITLEFTHNYKDF
ncbi:hypothetical protein RhiirA4_461342 [Rhizophagus irregularis]|uniref:Uncharacterized protein n=1 Tax=Rhizophagus irregularis TaxID=588596 RepID=A0A2I1GIN4_9GLOM|nr:hypothetical protein RhiirA4_461342 [Rhizophagus irregularis]